MRSQHLPETATRRELVAFRLWFGVLQTRWRRLMRKRACADRCDERTRERRRRSPRGSSRWRAAPRSDQRRAHRASARARRQRARRAVCSPAEWDTFAQVVAEKAMEWEWRAMAFEMGGVAARAKVLLLLMTQLNWAALLHSAPQIPFGFLLVQRSQHPQLDCMPGWHSLSLHSLAFNLLENSSIIWADLMGIRHVLVFIDCWILWHFPLQELIGNPEIHKK